MKFSYFSRKYIFVLICVFLLLLFAYLAAKGSWDLDKYAKVHDSSTIDMIDQRLNSLYLEIESFPRSTVNDVLFLTKLSSLRTLINATDSALKNEAIKKVEEDMLSFLQENSAYYQMRYIDEQGIGIVEVKFDEEGRRIVLLDGYQSEKDGYYFTKTMSLQAEEVFISSLDLNVENGKIENRGSNEDPDYVPVIRYATPVFDEQNNPKGIIIAHVYADYFLEDIEKFQREDETVLLINSDGYYLAHANKDKEFAFMFDRDDNFYNDYPEISKEALSDLSKRNIETDGLIFSFRHIFPTVSSFESYKGAEKIFGEHSEISHSWTLVIISAKSAVNKASKRLESDYLFFLIFSAVIILIVVALVFLLVVSKQGVIHKEDR